MKTKTAVLNGKPDAGNPHVRFDEGEVALTKPRRGSLLYAHRNLFALSLIVLVVVGVAGLSHAKTANSPRRVRIGAVNWDCSVPASTYFGGYQTRSLGPEKFRDRTPYYAKVLGKDRIDYPVRTLAEYEVEMRHAIDAGIDYFAYCWYDGQPFDGKHVSSGNTAVADEHVHELVWARRHHLQSELRRRIGFCAILVCCGPYKDESLRELASAMRDSSYETVEGRPLVYLFDKPWLDVLKRLNAFCAETGVPRPYAVRMSNSGMPKEDYTGIDAFGAYACTGHAPTFAKQCENGRRQNELRINHGKPVIPTFSVGWDPSPRLEHPVPWCGYEKKPYHPPATESELCQGAREFSAWMGTHRDSLVPGQLLVFAWNEFEEGGWICPNLAPDGSADLRRRDAFAKAAAILGNASTFPSSVQ